MKIQKNIFRTQIIQLYVLWHFSAQFDDKWVRAAARIQERPGEQRLRISEWVTPPPKPEEVLTKGEPGMVNRGERDSEHQ